MEASGGSNNQPRPVDFRSTRAKSFPGSHHNRRAVNPNGSDPECSADTSAQGAAKKYYHRTLFPKDAARILSVLPMISDAASRLYEFCTCTPKIRGQVRPATETDEEYFVCLADLFRCYRWLTCSAGRDDMRTKENYARITIARLREGIDVIERVIPFVEPSFADPWIRVAIRNAMCCGVQAIANATRHCPQVQESVWPEFYEIVGSLIVLEEDKLLNYISAALVNCMTDQRLEQIVDRGYAARIFERISVFGSREDCMLAFEAVFDLAGYLLKSPDVAHRDFDLLPLSAKCAMLDLLSSTFSLNDRGTNQPVPPFWPEKIAQEFIANAQCLMRLKGMQTHADEECELVLKALEMLGNLTSGEQVRRHFLRNTELLDRVIDMFIAIDNAGRDGSNQFSAVNKLSDVKPQDLVTPSRGLKSQLLRVLANLVYNNPELEERAIQRNIVRHLKENARIDFRNPYIQQWAILAIRNLQFSAALEEIRREHDRQEVSPPPGVAHSVDGDIVYDRKLSDGLTRFRGFQHSDTVEALDLHGIHNEPGRSHHRKSVRKEPHLVRTHKKHGRRLAKTDQETQTSCQSLSVSSDSSAPDRYPSSSSSAATFSSERGFGDGGRQDDVLTRHAVYGGKVGDRRNTEELNAKEDELERRPRHQSS